MIYCGKVNHKISRSVVKKKITKLINLSQGEKKKKKEICQLIAGKYRKLFQLEMGKKS